MLRAFLCAAALALFTGGLVAADAKDKAAKGGKKKQAHATITKVDAKKGEVTVRMKNKEGKEVTRTFKLTEEVRYLDSTGKVAALDIFTSGDYVLLVEEEGQLKQMKKAKKGAGKKPKEKTGTKEGK